MIGTTWVHPQAHISQAEAQIAINCCSWLPNWQWGVWLWRGCSAGSVLLMLWSISTFNEYHYFRYYINTAMAAKSISSISPPRPATRSINSTWNTINMSAQAHVLPIQYNWYRYHAASYQFYSSSHDWAKMIQPLYYIVIQIHSDN